MAFLERFFGIGKKETIDENKEREHNNAEHTPESQEYENFAKAVNDGLDRRGKDMEKSMRNRRWRGFVTALGLLGITALATPAEGRDIYDVLNNVIRSGEHVVNKQQDVGLKKYKADTELSIATLKAKNADLKAQLDYLKQEMKEDTTRHRDDQNLEGKKVVYGARSTDVKARETAAVLKEKLRQEANVDKEKLRQGVVPMGGKRKIETTGLGSMNEEEGSDVVGADQVRKGVVTSPLPGERAESSFSSELSDRDRDALAQRAVSDYERRGRPTRDFDEMTEQEREVYGHAWNNLEKNIGKTGTILSSRD